MSDSHAQATPVWRFRCDAFQMFVLRLSGTPSRLAWSFARSFSAVPSFALDFRDSKVAAYMSKIKQVVQDRKDPVLGEISGENLLRLRTLDGVYHRACEVLKEVTHLEELHKGKSSDRPK